MVAYSNIIDNMGGVLQVACMVRIEVEKMQRLMFQVTVGSSDVNTSAALKDLIAQLLARI